MHDCLLVNPILCTIFEDVYAQSKGSTALAALARTCRFFSGLHFFMRHNLDRPPKNFNFSDPALDILWRKPGLSSLIQCMPPDLWMIEAENIDNVRYGRDYFLVSKNHSVLNPKEKLATIPSPSADH
jgi:hypothetical protein